MNNCLQKALYKFRLLKYFIANDRFLCTFISIKYIARILFLLIILSIIIYEINIYEDIAIDCEVFISYNKLICCNFLHSYSYFCEYHNFLNNF